MTIKRYDGRSLAVPKINSEIIIKSTHTCVIIATLIVVHGQAPGLGPRTIIAVKNGKYNAIRRVQSVFTVIRVFMTF